MTKSHRLELLYDLRAAKMKGDCCSPRVRICPFERLSGLWAYVVCVGILLPGIPIAADGQGTHIPLSTANPVQFVVSAHCLPDPEARWSIQDIRTDSTLAFQEYSAASPVYTDSIKDYWIRFTVRNTDSIDREWIFNFDGWSYVHFHTDEPDIPVQHAGHLLPVSKRDYPVANKNNILTLLKREETKTCYVLLQARPDHVISPSGLGFKVSLRSFQDQEDHKHRQIISIFIGIYAVMFLYNLFVYTSTKDKSFIYYLLFILGLTYMTLNNAGYAVSIFGSVFENFPMSRGAIESFVSAFNTVIAILFTTSILNTREYLPRWDKILRYTIIAIVITLIGTNVFFNFFKPIAALLMIFILISFIMVGVKGVRKKVPSAPYYLLAYVFSIAGTAVIALTVLGVLPLNDFTFSYSMPTGHALQILFFSFALANRINVLKKSNEESQKRIIEHLKENERLQLQVTEELEEKVAQRTQEVVRQKEVIEAEKEKSEKLLYNILPQTIARELIETGKTSPARYEEVSILFTDFVDFTHISASIPPAKLVNELNAIFFEFDDIIRETGLEKIKTIGDSYMAVAGLPIERADHAARCVRAAVEMFRKLEERNQASSIKWNMRAGIHSGSVVAGVVGKQKFTFDLWGDAVNLASRMESAGMPGKINLSAYTYDLIRDEFQGTYRGKISIKGKGDIDMYYIDVNSH